MRLILTVGLYLAYIQTFCDYLLTGNYSLTPTDPAGLLAHAPQLEQVLARPDGVFLCALFAVGCCGVASFLITSLRNVVAFAAVTGAEVSYGNGRVAYGNFRASAPGLAPHMEGAKAVTNIDNQGPAPTSKDMAASRPAPADHTFSQYVGPADSSTPKAPGKQDLPPDQPTK